MIHDVIPDIHGDPGRLVRTLTALGYAPSSDDPTDWRPPAGHRAVFLGDFIDGGSANRAVLEIVRAMIGRGDALAVMGNHELNAILYHTRGKAGGALQDGWMRAHTAKNAAQHGSFLREYAGDPEALADAIGWFMTLPLALDLGDLRVVHACWSDRALAVVRARRPDLRLQPMDLQEVALERIDFARAVLTLTKGPETDLPDGVAFRDFHGHERRQMRLKWWGQSGTATWRSAALSVPDPALLPDRPIADLPDFEVYPADAPRCVFGHYKMDGDDGPAAEERALCLDWPHRPLAWSSRDGGKIIAA